MAARTEADLRAAAAAEALRAELDAAAAEQLRATGAEAAAKAEALAQAAKEEYQAELEVSLTLPDWCRGWCQEETVAINQGLQRSSLP